ncbi:MAG: hypothetical protein Q7U04_14000 [Bacteriovorax sp.]|nr:hypothetical protein [Bacteriovorax sp.]
MKTFLITTLIFMSFGISAQDNAPEKKNTVYKYKEYEVIDLGSMEIKGQIIAPGDLTVNERERKVFKRSLLEKENFDFENKREIENLR